MENYTDLTELERIIQCSTVDGVHKQDAIRMIDKLRVSPNRWTTGLKLFFEARQPLSQFFGLSLIRDFLSNLELSKATESARLTIRESVISWLNSYLTSPATDSSVPMLNNMVSIFTLCLKLDYPEQWPSAFAELLQTGSQHGSKGLDFTVRVLLEMEIEVVMFQEGRSAQEIQHNVLIKDVMRTSNTIQDILSFLLQGVRGSLQEQQQEELCVRCLHCLAELIGWVDVQLTISMVLPLLYAVLHGNTDVPPPPEVAPLTSGILDVPRSVLLGSGLIRAKACACLFELVKKGMDPVLKIQMIESVHLTRVLAAVDTRMPAHRGVQSSAIQERHTRFLQQLGLLLDILVLELMGSWAKFEDSVAKSLRDNRPQKPMTDFGGPTSKSEKVKNSPTSEESQELMKVAPVLSEALETVVPKLLELLRYRSEDEDEGDVYSATVASAVLPGSNKLVSLMKQESSRPAQFFSVLGKIVVGQGKTLFRPSGYLDAVLVGLHSQSLGLGDIDEEDPDDEVSEARNNMRKLFVNCCRANPQRSLEFLGVLLSNLPLPLSSAPAEPIDAVLRLMHCFCECGPGYRDLVNTGSFPALLNALHQSDVANHSQPQVLLSYFELVLRYVKVAELENVLRATTLISTERGIGSPHAGIRSRCAYLLIKIAESLENKSDLLLDSIGYSLADTLLANSEGILEILSVNNRYSNTPEHRNPTLPPSSTIHVAEALAFMISTATAHFNAALESGENTGASRARPALLLLEKVLGEQLQQIARVLRYCDGLKNSSMFLQLSESFVLEVAFKLNILSSLTKGFTLKAHGSCVFLFTTAAESAVTLFLCFSHCSQVFTPMLALLHKLVVCVGLPSLDYVARVYPSLLQLTEMSTVEAILQLSNLCLVEFEERAFSFISSLLLPTLGKIQALAQKISDQFSLLSSGSQSEGSLVASSGVLLTPTKLNEQAAELHKMLCLFLHHVVIHKCGGVLLLHEHWAVLEWVLEFTLNGIKGVSLHGGPVSAAEGGLIMRRNALQLLLDLVNHWQPILTNTDPTLVGELPPGFVQTIQDYLLVQVVPVTFYSCSGRKKSPDRLSTVDLIVFDVRDAAAQGVLSEIAAFMRAIHGLLQDRAGAYFSEVLTRLGWTSETTQGFLQILGSGSPLGTFREEFKRFIRANMG